MIGAVAPGVAVGVDAGGTAFRALVVGPDGAELSRGQVPSARWIAGLPGPAITAIRAVVEQACARAEVELPVPSLWAGMAGAGREAVRAELEAALARSGIARRVGVGTDVEAAFEDAFRSGPGILLMSGTGSIAYGRADDGREARVGGWGSLLGDEGSGYAIGVEAMRRVARSVDGRGPRTALGGRVLARLRLNEPEELIPWSSAAPRSEIAALVPEVEAAAASGDEVAGQILVQAVAELEVHVLTLLASLGPWAHPPTVALGGGLLQPDGPLRRPMERVLRSHGLPGLDRALDPTRGAARRAADQAARA